MKLLKFYSKPFHPAKYGSWVYDGKNNFVFQFDEVQKYDEFGRYLPEVKANREAVIFALNAIDHEPVEELNLSVNPKDPTEVFNNGELFITIRGWGNLTGVGGYNLPPEDAEKIQDDFRDWMIYKLTKQ